MVTGDNSLFFASVLDNSGLKRGALDATNIISGLASKISKINPFAALAVGAASAFAVIGQEAFDFAKRYEQAMLEVRTISKAAQDDFRGTGNDIFALSQKTLDDPIKLSRAYYQIVSAGYDGAKGLHLLEVASKAATAGVTDTETAADGITTVLNAFGESADKANSVADAMFKTVELGKTNFEQLSSTLSTVAPLASSLGVSYNEVLAAVASLTKQGVPTAQAMTQIRAALIGVNENLGDGWANAYTFQEALQELARRSDGSTQKLTKMLGRIEGVSAVLATTGENAQGAADDLKTLESATGSAEKAFRTMASGQINQMQILKNRIKSVTESLGNDLLDVANKAAGALLDLTDSGSFSGDQYLKEKDAVKDLVIELENTSSTIERRKEIIDELKDAYPAYLKDIQNEGILTQELKFALSDVNDQLLLRYQLAGNQEEASEVALEIAQKEKEQRKDIIQLEKELDAIKSAAFKDRIKFLESQQGRELSYLEKSEVAFELLGNQAAGVATKFNEVRENGKSLVVLRSRFKELTGQSEDLNNSINDFEVKDTSADLTNAGNKELTTYEDFLKKKAKAYEDFENQVIQLGRARAEEINKGLLDDAVNYGDFLEKQLELYRGAVDKEKAIAEAAKKAGFQGLASTRELQKVDVEIQPSVQDIQLSSSSIQRLIAKLKREVENSGALSNEDASTNIARIAEKEIDAVRNVNTIKKLEIQNLEKVRDKISEESYKKRLKRIEEENKGFLALIKKQTDALLKDIPQQILDAALDGTDLSFQNLNDATLGQLNKLEKKLEDIKIDAGQLLDLGLSKEQVERALVLFNEMKEANQSNIDTAQAKEISKIFGSIGAAFTQAGDTVTAQIGQLVSSLGSAIATINDSNASGLEKASGFVGLIIQAGNLIKDIGDEQFFADVNAQKDINKRLAEQVAMENRINEIRRERAELERNSSAFLDSFYKEDFVAALNKQTESEKSLNEAMQKLSENGVFTAEGIGKRLLFGKKNENRDFSIGQILGDFSLQEYFASSGGDAKSRFFDPLSIFGGYSDVKVSKDALNKLRESFDVTLKAMGKTNADMARFSSAEWLDFFTVMEEGGHIVDEGTQSLLNNAKESLEEYNESVEQMRDIISDFAGSLGDDLANALVSAFEDGGNAADKFMESVNDIINQLFVQELIDSQFRSYFDDLQKQMEESFRADGDQSWIDDIQRFSEGISPAMNQAVAAMEAFNNATQEAGFAGFDGSSSDSGQGLSGSISTITEDTAGLLAGYINAMRLDVSTGVDIARSSNRYLSDISNNTSELVSEMRTNNVRLKNIENALA